MSDTSFHVHRILPLETRLTIGDVDTEALTLQARTLTASAPSLTLDAMNATVKATNRLTLDTANGTEVTGPAAIRGKLSLGSDAMGLQLEHRPADQEVLLSGNSAITVAVPVHLDEENLNVGGVDARTFIRGVIVDSFEDPAFIAQLKLVVESVYRDLQNSIQNITGEGGPSLF